MNCAIRILITLSGAAFSMAAAAQDMSIDPANIVPPAAEYSPYLEHHYPDRVYFGDTHVHTSYSTDAGFFGNRSVCTHSVLRSRSRRSEMNAGLADSP